MKKKIISLIILGAISTSSFADFSIVDIPPTKNNSQNGSGGKLKFENVNKSKFEENSDVNINIQALENSQYVDTSIKQKNELYGNEYLAQIGQQDRFIHKSEGYAKGLPINVVLQQIVPKGWDGKAVQGFNKNKKISWVGGKSWVDTLEDVARDNNLSILVNWNDRTVTVKDLKSNASNSKEVFNSDLYKNKLDVSRVNVTESESGDMYLTSGVPTSKPQWGGNLNSKPIANPNKTWTLEAGKTLRENLSNMAKKSGWQITEESWEGSDYMVDVSVTLRGEFDDAENGPIAQIAEAYSKAQQPLVFNLMEGNKTLYVKNYEYQ